VNGDTPNPLFSAERWNRVRGLLDELSELSPEGQAQRLERIAADDPDLAATLRALLLGTSASTTPSVQTVFERLLPAETMPASIGPFRLCKRIGAGGMGVVYLAERRGADFTQRVALKLLDGDAARMSHLAARERRILAALAHPNITAFIDAGSENARAWLAMEYVDGVPLHDYCQQHTLHTPERVRLFDQVCAAVAHAHSQLVVHRDLKPSNVLVAADGTVKLLDFGIALVLDPNDEQMPATRVFTPEYAAPEQLRGERATTATDVYGLGLMLYELVCDKRLPTLERSGGDAEWTTAELARHATTKTQTDTQETSTTVESKTLSRLLRGDLGRIIAHALAPKPAQRYASVALLREDLARWLDHRPLTIARPGLGYTIGRFVRRHRLAVAAATIALAALLALTATSLWLAHERRLEAERAVAQAQRAEAMQKFMTDVIHQASPDENGGEAISSRQLIEKGELLAAGFDKQPDLQAEVLALIGEMYLSIDDNAAAEKALVRAQRLVDPPATPPRVRARVLLALAQWENMVTKTDDALAHSRESLALYLRDPGVDAKTIAEVDISIAQALDAKGDSAQTENFLREAVGRDSAALGDKDDSVAELWLLLGYTLATRGQLDEAEHASRNGVQAYRAIYGNDGFEVAHALNELALVLAWRKDGLGAAEDALRESVRIFRKLVGENHQKTVSAERNLLTMIERRGHYAEALPEREQLIARAERPGISSPRELATQYQALAYDYAQAGRFTDAEAALRRSLAFGEQAQGPRHPADQAARGELGELLTSLGRYDEAERVLRDAMAMEHARETPEPLKLKALQACLGDLLRLQHRNSEALSLLQEVTTLSTPLPDDNTWRPLALARLSEAQLDSGDATLAATTAQSALDYSRKAFMPDHSRNGFALFALARAQLALGRATQAEPLLREALKVRSPPHPATHPRVLEVDVALAQALAAQGKREPARALASQIKPRLQASSSPYAADLLARLGAP
jgi:predicted Ser/Thr protein kinase